MNGARRTLILGPLKAKSCLFRVLLFTAVQAIVGAHSAWAACGGTLRTWDGSASTAWTDNNNWSGGNRPNSSTEDAKIISQANNPEAPTGYTIGCFELISGTMNATAGGSLRIQGDYFRNLNLGSIASGSAFVVTMNGAAAQTFENVDPIDNLTLTNATSVELTDTFTVTSTLAISAGTGVVYIDSTVTLSNAAVPLVIPASATVEVKSGAILNAFGGITINGVLKIDGGGKVILGDGEAVIVASGGVLQMIGSSGSVAAMDALGGTSYSLTVNSGGAINLNYFSMSRCRVSVG